MLPHGQRRSQPHPVLQNERRERDAEEQGRERQHYHWVRLRCESGGSKRSGHDMIVISRAFKQECRFDRTQSLFRFPHALFLVRQGYSMLPSSHRKRILAVLTRRHSTSPVTAKAMKQAFSRRR